MNAFNPLTPSALVLAASGAWTDMDVHLLIPAGATGVILHVYLDGSENNTYAFGLRKKGSGDNRINSVNNISGIAPHFWAMIGVDGSLIFEYYVGSTTKIAIKLVGYTGPEVTFLDNGVDKTTPVDTVNWNDIDCSVEAPAGTIGIIFEQNGGMAYPRKKGSTDDRRLRAINHNCFGAIIGCDTNRKCQGWNQFGAATDCLYMIGYVTGGAIFNTNATGLTPGAGAYADIAVPSSAMVFIAMHITVTYYYFALRKDGSAEDIYERAYYCPMAAIEPLTAVTIEGKRSNADLTMWLVGYGTTTQAYKDIATRFALATGQSFEDIATRFALATGQSFKDIATRFKLSIQGHKDISTRFKLIVPGKYDLLPNGNGRCGIGGPLGGGGNWNQIWIPTSWGGPFGSRFIDETGTVPNGLMFIQDTLTVSQYLGRSHLFYDLSSIPPGLVIKSAKIRIFVTILHSDAAEDIVITQGQPAEPPAVIADWSNQNTFLTYLGQVNDVPFTVNAYNDIPFNAAGLAYLKAHLGGEAKLCIRTERDINNNPRVGVFTHQVIFWGYPTTVDPPLLEIDTAAPGGGGNVTKLKAAGLLP